jgi:hypothetical protein
VRRINSIKPQMTFYLTTTKIKASKERRGLRMRPFSWKSSCSGQGQ